MTTNATNNVDAKKNKINKQIAISIAGIIGIASAITVSCIKDLRRHREVKKEGERILELLKNLPEEES